jgi:hypothetical protein
MSSLALYALSLMLFFFPPGRSSFSLEAMPECGTDPKAPTCEIRRLCDDAKDVTCNRPRWEPRYVAFPEPEGAWVRAETKEAGARRLEVAAQALADATMAAAPWERGPADFVRVFLATTAWGTGLREDIQVARIRGPGGEVCLDDVQIKTLRAWVPFDLAALPEKELISKVVGRRYPELRRCFDAGVVGVLRTWREAKLRCARVVNEDPITHKRSPRPLEESLFGLYHMGNQCTSASMGPLFEALDRKRLRTLERMRERRQTIFPDWYTPPHETR